MNSKKRGVKLIVQIPCYNEEQTLGSVLSEIPTTIEGVDIIETMIIDDGSSDKTVEVAKAHNVTHVIKHIGNKGLGRAFASGANYALENGADILVNTDGDNQYPGKYISDIIRPILDNSADIVLGDRQTKTIKHFSPLKKFFQWLGSLLVRLLSGTMVPDSVSGFRAYSRESLLKLNITSDFSYAVDTLVQAGSKKLKVLSVDIQTNPPTRKSRLFKNMFHHMYETFSILIRVYSMYHPMKLFFSIASIFSLIGVLGVLRFLYYFVTTEGNTGLIQSLILSGTFLVIASVFFALGILGDLISKNRKLIEDNLYLSKKMYYNNKDNS